MARHVFKGKQRRCEFDENNKRKIRDADYIRAVNLFNLTCSDLTTKTDTAIVKAAKKTYRALSLKYHPDQYKWADAHGGKNKHTAKVAKESFEQLDNAHKLIKDTPSSDLLGHVCDAGVLKTIEGEDKDVGDRIHKVFSYCDDPATYVPKDYIPHPGFFIEEFLPHEVARVNSILKKDDPNFDFDKVDPAIQGHVMDFAALWEEILS
jgi:hypothetical protein